MSVSTLFGGERIARAYAEDRPYFHPHVMAIIRRRLGAEQNDLRALDVGCGAGLSAQALRGIAASVVAVDASLPMLRVARESPGPVFAGAAGESLPFRDGVFDLITAAGVVDWIDRSRFLPEARRVLRPGGCLALYDIREDGVEFAAWHREFQRRFPKPPRRAVDISPGEAQAAGFAPPRMEAYSLDIPFDLGRYVRFALTQSNITSAVEGGQATIDEIRRLISAELLPLFAGQELTLAFSGYVIFLGAEA